MRTLASLALVLALACTTAAPPPAPPPVPTAQQPAQPHGFTVDEEARILAMEDQRLIDRSIAVEWLKHPNAPHRQRLALALGRIGPHVFIDANNDGDFDPPAEKRAGVDELATLANDPDRRVRETVAFALGEIGDTSAAETLFQMTNDADAAVAAEAAEALSKLTDDPAFVEGSLARYIAIGEGSAPDGVRARAVRFLFRFNNDAASAAAMRALASPSAAIKQEGAYALARRAFAAAQPQLELLMNDTNALARAYATTALGRIGAPSSAPLLIAALGDVHPWVRTNAAVAIGRVAEKDRAILKTDDLPRVFASTEDPDPGARVSIIDTIGYYAEVNETARQRLIDVYRNGSQWERELAAGAIAKHLSAEAAMAALGDTLSSWSKVRVIEATAAAPHGAEIRKRYASAPEALVRVAAIGAIPDDRVDAELELIRTGLGDDDVMVRAAALDRYALVKPAEPADTPHDVLQAAQVSEQKSALNDARLSAIAAIARIDHPDRERFLRSLLKDRDPVVRRIAAEAIVEQLKGSLPQYAPFDAQRTPEQYAEIALWSRQPHTATIHMTRGAIELALLTQEAPLTTWNFAQLAKKGYFNNSSFMRVVPNFVIQGGDPRNDMSGGPGYAIRDEINLQKYTRGAVGMALSGADTGGSQFFITHSPQPHLDGGYTIFGRVYDGMSSVVDQTERGDRVERITIDEHPPVSAEVVGGVANVSLPLEIGAMTGERVLARVPEYVARKSGYTPDMAVIEMMKSYVRSGDHVEVIMGTWCPDSLREVPKFLRIVDDLKSQFGVELPATFVAVDRSKQQPAQLIAGKDVRKISTFIYYRGERELGRIIERPQGLFEDDLLAIAAKQ